MTHTTSDEQLPETGERAGAREANATRINAVRRAIEALGIPREDVSTAGYMEYATR